MLSFRHFQKRRIHTHPFTFSCLDNSAGLDGIIFLMNIPDICWPSLEMFTYRAQREEIKNRVRLLLDDYDMHNNYIAI